MSKKALILRDEMQNWAETWMGSFAEGLLKHDWEVKFSTSYEKSDIVVLWGQRKKNIIRDQKRSSGHICMLERGYVGDRLKQWSSVSFGGELNNRGVFRGPFSDGSRWKMYFEDLVRPWKKDQGGYVLLLGQIPGDRSLGGISLDLFYRKVVKEFTAQGYDVCYRQHPVAEQRGYMVAEFGAKILRGSFEEALSGAAFTISFNSNSGVLSVLSGIPTIAIDPGSMAWEVAGHEYSPPPEVDRTSWMHALAWKQWQKSEMSSGECWEHIKGDL